MDRILRFIDCKVNDITNNGYDFTGTDNVARFWVQTDICTVGKEAAKQTMIVLPALVIIYYHVGN